MSDHKCAIPDKFWVLADDLCKTTMRTKQVQEEMLYHERSIMKRGQLKTLTSRRVGPGIYELGIRPWVSR